MPSIAINRVLLLAYRVSARLSLLLGSVAPKGHIKSLLRLRDDVSFLPMLVCIGVVLVLLPLNECHLHCSPLRVRV